MATFAVVCLFNWWRTAWPRAKSLGKIVGGKKRIVRKMWVNHNHTMQDPEIILNYHVLLMSCSPEIIPIVLVCSRGSAVKTGFVALEGHPAPALLTAQTLNWYRAPSFKPNTGKWHIFWMCTLQRSHSPWLSSHLKQNKKSERLFRTSETFIIEQRKNYKCIWIGD